MHTLNKGTNNDLMQAMADLAYEGYKTQSEIHRIEKGESRYKMKGRLAVLNLQSRDLKSAWMTMIEICQSQGWDHCEFSAAKVEAWDKLVAEGLGY